MHVVVCGGGIVGLAAAYYLADRGADVTVCEAGSLGSGNTDRSAGGIRTQFSTPVNVDLSLASLDVWTHFEEWFGVDIAHRQSGYLFCARDSDTAETLRESAAMQQDRGVPVEVLDPDAAREHVPELHADRYAVATFSPVDGFADPHLALQGFSTAAQDAGAEIRTHTPVTGVEISGGDSGSGTGGPADVRVETPDESIVADFVVNAAGAWARRVGALAGVDLPIAPRRRQVAVVDPETPVPESVPLTIDLDSGSYFRPEREGQAIVGGQFASEDPDVDPDDYDTGMDLDWAVTAVERAGETAGYFGPDSGIVRGWAGLYAVTPDHHPVVEVSRPGVVTAAGFSGHGFQHAPATGQLVAELCLDGEASLVDVSGLDRERFERGAPVDEQHVA